MTPRPARWALVRPAVVAACLPLAVRVAVWLAAPDRPLVSEAGILAFQVVWTALPFGLVASLVATKAPLRPSFGLAAGVGLAMTLAGWLWVAWESVREVTGRGSGDANIGLGIMMLALPVAVLSVMITVIAVRGAFAGGPPRG